MFTYATPAQVGISAKSIHTLVKALEEMGKESHSIIMARGNQIFYEQYWEPFHAQLPHRLYSSTKSFVSIAVGFAIDDGLCALDDKIVDYFPDDVPDDVLPAIRQQTIRNMLMMSTGYLPSCGNWFIDHEDRVKFYFSHNRECNRSPKEFSKYPGAFYDYDSTGTFILGAMVERLTGKSLEAYLREKLFDKIGVSESAHFLKCPGGHSWGDSAMVCTPQDFLKVARFVLNYGCHNGQQLLSRQYLVDATSPLISNGDRTNYKSFGYGYQFFATWDNCFFFNGAGSNIALCCPEKDMILVYNGDTEARETLIYRFIKEIMAPASDTPLPDDEDNLAALNAYSKSLKLRSVTVNSATNIQQRISEKTYRLNENTAGITKIRLDFDDDGGVFSYTNAQGFKQLPFGICYNKIVPFPQEGYSREVATHFAPGSFYKCASSAGWCEPNKFYISARIIDEYLGGFHFHFYFASENHVVFLSHGGGEAFGSEYHGYAEGFYEKDD